MTDIQHQAMSLSWLEEQLAGLAKNNKQCMALSTSEAEYMALGSSVQEAIWLQRLLTDLKINTAKPTNILEDNQSAIAMCNKNPVGHKRAIRTLILNTTLPEKHCKLEPFL